MKKVSKVISVLLVVMMLISAGSTVLAAVARC